MGTRPHPPLALLYSQAVKLGGDKKRGIGRIWKGKKLRKQL